MVQPCCCRARYCSLALLVAEPQTRRCDAYTHVSHSTKYGRQSYILPIVKLPEVLSQFLHSATVQFHVTHAPMQYHKRQNICSKRVRCEQAVLHACRR